MVIAGLASPLPHRGCQLASPPLATLEGLPLESSHSSICLGA